MSVGFRPLQPQKAKVITVVQGDYAISRDPDTTLSTILGSCVAVCLFDPKNRVGGMNHFLLPTDRGESGRNIRYGAHAMELLINELMKSGGQRANFQAKIFGGARMIGSLGDIGGANAVFAREFLAREGIACLSESVGGTSARRLQFVPTTGAARQMLVGNVDTVPATVPPRPQAAKAADITLF